MPKPATTRLSFTARPVKTAPACPPRFCSAVLGVERPIIEADYLLTNRDVDRQVDFVETNVGLPEGVDRELMKHHAGVPEDAMVDFLNGLEERWGGPLEYLRSIGITDAQMAAIREEFLQS